MSGQYVQDREAKMYAEKYHRAQATTRRMDPEHLQEVEHKLEETALGLLDEKDRNRALSSLDEKVCLGLGGLALSSSDSSEHSPERTAHTLCEAEEFDVLEWLS